MMDATDEDAWRSRMNGSGGDRGAPHGPPPGGSGDRGGDVDAAEAQAIRDEQIDPDDALVSLLDDWADRLRRCAANTDDPVYAVISSLQRLNARTTPSRARSCRDVVATIVERARELWVSLRLGADELVRVRPGGNAVLMGPTGAGKTSCAAGMLISHVADGGVAIVLSRELPADELVARMIGIQCDASWVDVLTGRVARSEMERVTSERMLVLDRKHATLAELDAAIEHARTEYPDASILVAIDYLQILESDERDTRAKVADIVLQVDEIARRHRIVVLALSQMSRAASRAARNGEAIGADSTDGGAESAAIERAATVTLSIGAAGPEREDGTRAVDLSIGKGRMTGGDRVLPMSYCGRTGRWRLAGEARPAAEVKAERDGQRDSAKRRTAELAIAAAAGESTEPKTRAELGVLAGVGSNTLRTAAIVALCKRGELVEVRQRANPRGTPAWKLWTRERAVTAEVEIVEVAQ